MGGMVTVNGTKVARKEGDIWTSNEKAAGPLDFSVTISEKTTIKIYGSEGCCDGWQRIW
jgi:hypothetical protein